MSEIEGDNRQSLDYNGNSDINRLKSARQHRSLNSILSRDILHSAAQFMPTDVSRDKTIAVIIRNMFACSSIDACHSVVALSLLSTNNHPSPFTKAAKFASHGGQAIPLSVMIAVMYLAGVMSNAGLATDTSSGNIR